MNKKGDFAGIFIFIIFAMVIIFVSGIFIYIGNTTETQLQASLGDKMFGDVNGSTTVTNTFGKVNLSYEALYWVSVFIIFAMMLGILIGSYMVTTKPVFIIPHIFISIIAVFISAGISNAYETIVTNPTLSGTFAGFIGANFIMLNLPIIVTVIAFAGAIIMFSRMGKREEFAVG